MRRHASVWLKQLRPTLLPQNHRGDLGCRLMIRESLVATLGLHGVFVKLPRIIDLYTRNKVRCLLVRNGLRTRGAQYEPFTNAVVLSSSPTHAGFLFRRKVFQEHASLHGFLSGFVNHNANSLNMKSNKSQTLFFLAKTHKL